MTTLLSLLGWLKGLPGWMWGILIFAAIVGGAYLWGNRNGYNRAQEEYAKLPVKTKTEWLPAVYQPPPTEERTVLPTAPVAQLDNGPELLVALAEVDRLRGDSAAFALRVSKLMTTKTGIDSNVVGTLSWSWLPLANNWDGWLRYRWYPKAIEYKYPKITEEKTLPHPPGHFIDLFVGGGVAGHASHPFADAGGMINGGLKVNTGSGFHLDLSPGFVIERRRAEAVFALYGQWVFTED